MNKLLLTAVFGLSFFAIFVIVLTLFGNVAYAGDTVRFEARILGPPESVI